MAALPRLTGFLRAFAGEDDHDYGALNNLAKKQKLRAERQSQRGLTWTKLLNLLHKHSSASRSQVENDLRELVRYAAEIAGRENTSDMLESSAAFLFETFIDAAGVGHQQTVKLRGLFGPFPASSATKACALVGRILKNLPDHVVDDLIESLKSGDDNNVEFGTGIKFVFPQGDDDNSDDDLTSESEDDEDAAMDFDFKYTLPAAGPVEGATAGAEKEPGSGPWLLAQVEQHFPGDHISVSEMATTISNLLKSSKTDDELQNELFDLLGFDRFEFIQSLFQNRSKLQRVSVESLNNEPPPRIIQAVKIPKEKRPNYGCQVTVETVEEKAMKKLMRKEEKKVSRKDGGVDFEDSGEFVLDPQQMRVQRELALQKAMTAPLFSRGKKGDYPEPETYPYVFDRNIEARKSSAFISGTKMTLPDGFSRKTFESHEEVIIPPSDPPPTNIGKTLVPISSLDEIGQLAFQGMKSLNKIQSIVFATAYKTNENMLICAPTGAGKTNIAMLAVLHELKQHLSQGVIKKDEFKIVYVAPMKALAAEMVRNFGKRLEALNITVKELTGDMQLTKQEILKTQMLVTTPEKWDVVTRKSTGDVALTQLVKLLIIDEVHLLNDDRGPVIESLVARTLRQIESSQNMIRIVGLSATLPNYMDVARFLNVNPWTGLFFFDGRFRPVPLGMTFVGINSNNKMDMLHKMNKVCYDKVLEQVRRGEQVMVFVHARNETVRTAMLLREMAKNMGDIALFLAEQDPKYGDAIKQISKSRNKELRELFPDGFATHHAGMLRQDRNLVEKYFGAGLVKVLVCTATLAWGVNLPAHAVIIKGTDLYDARRGSFVDLGILDVLQIFGRAGRPQFDKYGQATIITAQAKLAHYLSLLTRQNPIESQFTASLKDNLNAEVSLGTVTNVDEAVKWLSYTYLFVRMRCNPLAYGLPYDCLSNDPNLDNHRRELVIIAGRALDKAKMVRFDERTGYMSATDLGRTASHFYIKYETMEVINEKFAPLMTEGDVIGMVSQAQEFQQIKVRDEELEEMEVHMHSDCHMPVAGGVENPHGKVNILLQTYISRGYVDGFSLVSDSAYVAQNSGRIVRALFEMALRQGLPIMAGRLLALSKSIDKRLWGFEHPLRQFNTLGPEILHKIEEKRLTISRLQEMDPKEIGHMVRHVRMGATIKKCVNELPSVSLEATIQPITRTVLRVRLSITPEFSWNDRVHGNTSESFWIWVEDPDNNHIYHHEYFVLQKKQVLNQETQQLIFTIPIFEPLPTQYYVRATSDRWLGSEAVCAISFQHLILPERHPPHTDLLDLQPLPITALNDPFLESLYKFSHFNPIQTQIFHTVYHTDCNVLLGAPTGSGKTVAAEMAIFRVFRKYPKSKAVYIAPLKALVRERMEDWKIRIEKKLGKKVVELTGDVTPDLRAISNADLIVTTPEKWDGISRSWQNRSYVKAVSVLIIDEIHLLGDDRGPVLEVIVSRTNFISSHTSKPVRVVGLSTALANARDLADWLGIKEVGLFNFRPSVRPVPLEAHIAGFPGKHYCPRMATMNKPTFQAIRTHSPVKPALIFVSSRRQTRLTAIDLIAYLAAEDNPKQWMKMPEIEMENIITGIKDTNLKLTLAFGIGLHHAGLHERDRKTVEELYINQKIQVLIATATLAWGVNLPAHLVIIKGTEYFDGKLRRYVDFPITDVLQMMGRAGRPQFDDQGKAVILVHDVKKNFYKKFLYEPFPVESNLLEVLPEHLNAEIVAGTITSKQDAMDYITWTYFFRRLVMNPSFYNLDDTDHEQINKYLSGLVEKSLKDLESAYCCEIGDDSRTIEPLTLGRISSYYYLHHSSVRMFRDELRPDSTIPELIEILSNAHEYDELPVRHNEDQINSALAEKVPLEVNPHSYDSAHTKANILFQAHFCRTVLPCTDYYTDTKSVLDQAIRILQAMLDVTADQGWLATALRITHLVQMVIQGRWLHDSSLLTLPHLELYHLYCFKNPKDKGSSKKTPAMDCLPDVLAVVGDRFETMLSLLEDELTHTQIDEIFQVLLQLPVIGVELSVKGWWEGEDQGSKIVPMPRGAGRRQESDWVPVHADQEYVLNMRLRRKNKLKKHDSKAHAPRFPKVKDEGWFIILGEVETQDLIAIKRVGYVRGQTNVQLSFYTPEAVGRVIFTVYLISDSYLGLDQQYDICLDVIPASIEAQVNTELKDELDDLDFGDDSFEDNS